MPLDWAATQHNLGNVLLTLGKRTNENGRIAQATEAYLCGT